MTQCERILTFIEANGAITQRDAIELGCYRLASRVWDLRKAGYSITATNVPVTNKDGSKTYIAVYRKED